MNQQSKKISGLFIRYIIIVLAGLGNLYIFYKILTPLTIRAVALVLSIFTDPFVLGNTIYTKYAAIELIPACIAGAAFYLLFILVMSTPDIRPLKRLGLLAATLADLFILNVIRILILITLIRTPSFETAHWIFWHVISTVFVVGIWIAYVYIFKIKSVPIYSDVKYLAGLIKPRKKSKRGKKN